MPIFEITRETELGESETHWVEASTWVEAWRTCTLPNDDDDTAKISVRSLGNTVEVDIQAGSVRFRVRSTEVAGAEDPALASFEDTALDGQMSLAMLRTAARSGDVSVKPESVGNLPDTGPGPRPVTQDYESPGPRATVTTSRARPARRRLLSTQDHEAVPAPDTNQAAPKPADSQPSIRVDVSVPSDTAATTRTRAQRGDPRELPQLFTPMAEFGAIASGASGRDRTTLLQWAIETIWQQVPARMVLSLQVIGREITISHARGDAERTLRGSRASLEQWPAALDLRGPSRIRFGPEPVIVWLRGVDNMRYPLEITSAMWTPVGQGDVARGDTQRHPQANVLLVVDAKRSTGFTEGEFSALCYLNQVLANRLS